MSLTPRVSCTFPPPRPRSRPCGSLDLGEEERSVMSDHGVPLAPPLVIPTTRWDFGVLDTQHLVQALAEEHRGLKR